MSEQDPRLATNRSQTSDGPMVVGPAARRMQQVHGDVSKSGLSGAKKWAIRLGLTLVIIGGSAGGMYVAYNQGLEDGVSYEPPLMVAQDAPIKVLPTDPGGKEVPHQDKLVFEQLSGGTGASDAPVLAPPSEEALPRPEAGAELVSPDEMPRVFEPDVSPPPETTVFADPSLPEATIPDAGGAAVPAPQEVGTPAPVVPTQDLPTEATAGPQPLFSEDGTAANAASPETNSDPVEPAPEPTQTEVANADDTSIEVPSLEVPSLEVPRGPFYAQLGSFPDQNDAATEWQRLLSRHTDVLGGFDHRLHAVDLDDKGTYHRILVGGFADIESARAICDALAAKNLERCLVNRID